MHSNNAASLVAALAELFPAIFVREEWQPHIKADLFATGVTKGWETKVALRLYCSRRMYLLAVTDGGPRYDLNGNPTGEVSPEDREWARVQLAELDSRKVEKAASIRSAREAVCQASKVASARAWVAAHAGPRERLRSGPKRPREMAWLR